MSCRSCSGVGPSSFFAAARRGRPCAAPSWRQAARRRRQSLIQSPSPSPSHWAAAHPHLLSAEGGEGRKYPDVLDATKEPPRQSAGMSPGNDPTHAAAGTSAHLHAGLFSGGGAVAVAVTIAGRQHAHVRGLAPCITFTCDISTSSGGCEMQASAERRGALALGLHIAVSLNPSSASPGLRLPPPLPRPLPRPRAIQRFKRGKCPQMSSRKQKRCTCKQSGSWAGPISLVSTANL